MQIKDAMTNEVQYVDPSSTLAEIAANMEQNNIGCVLVGENDKLTGVVTDRDIVINCVAKGFDPRTTTAQEAMTDGVKYCFDTDKVADVLENMGEEQICRLPVVDQDKNLVGIISLGDLAQACEQSGTFEETVDKIKNAA